MTNDPRSTDNPFRSPTTDARAIGVRTGSLEEVYNVAKYQKSVLVCLLLQILVGLGFALAVPALPPTFVVLYYLLLLGLGILSTVFVFLLAVNVYSTGVGIVLGLLTMMPCLGLLMLVIVNGKATSVLRQNGIKVGFLGASLPQFERPT